MLRSLSALKSYNILDFVEEHNFEELTILASAICQSTVSLISLLGEDRQRFKSRKSLNSKENQALKRGHYLHNTRFNTLKN